MRVFGQLRNEEFNKHLFLAVETLEVSIDSFQVLTDELADRFLADC
jgi:hypothetical protein